MTAGDEEPLPPVTIDDPVLQEILAGVLRANRIQPLVEVRVVIAAGPIVYWGYQTDDLTVRDGFMPAGVSVNGETLMPDSLTPGQEEFEPRTMFLPWPPQPAQPNRP